MGGVRHRVARRPSREFVRLAALKWQTKLPPFVTSGLAQCELSRCPAWHRIPGPCVRPVDSSGTTTLSHEALELA